MGLITLEEERERVDDYRKFIKDMFRLDLELREERIPLRNVISTQEHIEKDKYVEVLELMKRGELDVPVLVEEHFEDDADVRYMVDGHTRGRCLLDIGKNYSDAFVLWYPGGDFHSGLSDMGRRLGYIRLGEMRIK